MIIDPSSLAVIGGALALGGGLAGSSWGIANAGCAGAATLAEEPDQFRNVIVLASLPMTQTFYGLIVLILIITTVIPKLPADSSAGLAIIGCGFITGMAEFFSGVYQGAVCASGISLLPKTKGKIFTHAMMLGVFVELFGILGLVFAIMALSLLGLM